MVTCRILIRMGQTKAMMEAQGMTNFGVFDTNGKMRLVSANLTTDQMRIFLGAFKTHCAIEGSAYEFNHFVNWLKKNYGIKIEYTDTTFQRVDM